MTFTPREVAALNRFANLFLNTGCDEDEATEVAESTYRRFLYDSNDIDTAISLLDIESYRYQDM